MTNEKTVAAASSVLAAIFLTALKIGVGILSASLGPLSEAAHSLLDLVAAAVTFLAVRAAEHPAGLNHPYGHGSIENQSALVEAGLLILTFAPSYTRRYGDCSSRRSRLTPARGRPASRQFRSW